MGLGAKEKQRLRALCRSLPAVKIFYFFGSRKRGDSGVASDFDFAALFDPKLKSGTAEIELKLLGKLIEICKSDAVDLVVLNRCMNSILKYNVITEGEALFERPGVRLNYEIATMNEYFDFRLLEQQYFRD